jgi:hypothetical protein
MRPAGVEICEKVKDAGLDDGPEGFVERRAEAVWPRAGIAVHRKKGRKNLVRREGFAQGRPATERCG